MSDSYQPLWYDAIPSLKRAVLLLRQLPPQYREVIAKQVMEYARGLKIVYGTHADKLGYDRVMAMMQLKVASQQFASDPYIVKALNETYALPADGRHQVGTRMLLCLQGVDQYLKAYTEDKRGNAQQERIAIYNIVQSVFNQELSVFEEQGQRRKEERQERLRQQQVLDAEAYVEDLVAEDNPVSPPFSSWDQPVLLHDQDTSLSERLAELQPACNLPSSNSLDAGPVALLNDDQDNEDTIFAQLVLLSEEEEEASACSEQTAFTESPHPSGLLHSQAVPLPEESLQSLSSAAEAPLPSSGIFTPQPIVLENAPAQWVPIVVVRESDLKISLQQVRSS